MNNALRITLMVFILLIIVFFAGSMYTKHIKKKIIDYQQKIQLFEEKINKIDELLAQNVEQKRELDKIKYQVKRFDKTILEYDSPPVTYDYLLDIVRKLDRDIVFDFNYSGQKENNGLINNSYLIKGSAGLNQIYHLINNIEKQKPIYYVYDLAISAPDLTVSDTISYSFMLDSVSEKIVPQKVDIELKSVKTETEVSKLFTCGLLEEKMFAEQEAKRRNKGLMDTNNIRLIAITEKEAFFRDNKGIFQVLKVGDAVKNGFLSSMDSDNGSVVFIVDIADGKKEERVFNVGSEVK